MNTFVTLSEKQSEGNNLDDVLTSVFFSKCCLFVLKCTTFLQRFALTNENFSLFYLLPDAQYAYIRLL